jgi:hypothetical protein
MRWRFLDELDPAQAALKRDVRRRIDAWWAEFQQQTERLDRVFHGREQFDLPEWMHEHLGAIDPRLRWEFGPAVRADGHRLVITPESERGLRPLAQSILDAAPPIAGWEFYGYRLAEDVDEAARMVEARRAGTITGAVCEVALGEHGLIDLTYRSPDTDGPDDEQARNAAFVATETLLGEDVLDHHIGAIEVDRLPADSAGKRTRAIPLDRLRDTVASLIESHRAQLPAEPHWKWARGEDVEWCCVERQGIEPAEDYPQWFDLRVAVTPNQALWSATHGRWAFCSDRLSRCGETFAYLKIDGVGGLERSEFADRGEIEDAINDALAGAGWGCTVGGGTGLRYSYVELALADLDGAVARLRERLRAGRLPRRTWLLFHDADLQDEWVGLYDETPAPPRSRDDDE